MTDQEIDEATFLIVSSKPWNRRLAEELQSCIGGRWIQISSSEQFTLSRVRELAPRYIFVPHWSEKIESAIVDTYECVIFHENDVPYGRGGSPIQNLIERGHRETVVSAIRAIEEFDAGAVYLKRPVSLHGTASEIFWRVNIIVRDMIVEIVRSDIKPFPQSGQVVTFKRRTPEQSDLSELTELSKVFDYIRMLDAEGYPHAFIESASLRFEFTSATYQEGEVCASVRITKR